MITESTSFWFVAYFLTPVAATLGLYFSMWWTPDGRRRWEILVARKRQPLPGWSRLNTPSRVIYHCPNSPENDGVKRLFHEGATESKKIKSKIVKVLDKGSKRRVAPSTIDTWEILTDTATCHIIYRREPFMAGGWAQTKGESTSDCILGLEKFFCRLGAWTESAVGHELVHTAQEVREFALRQEWRQLPFWRSFWRFFRIEGEAHLHFWLWPLTLLLALVPVVLLGLAFWRDLWDFSPR